MTKLTDETLMYYADGLLSPSEQEWVEKIVADDPELQARLQIFRLTGRGLADLLEEDADDPVPAKLRDFVLEQEIRPAGAPRRRGANGGSRFQAGMARLRTVPASKFGTALAASLTLVAGIGLGWLLRGDMTSKAIALNDLVHIENNRVVALGPLQRALDALPSGVPATLALSAGKEVRLKIKMTFRNEAKDYCREYEIVAPTTEPYAAVACRIGGQWSLALQALIAPSNPAAGKISPAGGGSPVMDAAVGALMDGDPLGRDDEAAILRKAWEK